MIEVARLYRLESGSALKAFADVIIGSVLIKGVRVAVGRNENLYVSMPKAQGKDGKWYDTMKILDDELKNELQEVVLAAYQV
jgi:DNA-binding cell septation regulator SpoVG